MLMTLDDEKILECICSERPITTCARDLVRTRPACLLDR